MVYREMRGQLWGIAGRTVAGVLLTILTVLTSFGGGMLRRARKLKVLNRSNREKSAAKPERKIEDDASDRSACPKNRASGSKPLRSNDVVTVGTGGHGDPDHCGFMFYE